MSTWEKTHSSNATAEIIESNWTEHTSDHYPIQVVGPKVAVKELLEEEEL